MAEKMQRTISSRSKAKGESLFLTKLPTELLREIITHLDTASLLSLTLVNHYTHSVISSSHTWRLLFDAWFFECRNQFTPLTAPPDIAATKQQPDDLEHNHWRTEAILRTRLLRNLSKSRPELVNAGHHSTPKYVPAVNSAVKKPSPRPSAKIFEYFHSITLPIAKIHINWQHEPLPPNQTKFPDAPQFHPLPQVRITSENGDAALWHPGDGTSIDQGGTMVYTRYENRTGNLGISCVCNMADLHANGSSSFAIIGRDHSNRQALYYGFRIGSGACMENISELVTPRTGIGLGVWIADLAGLGCIEGIGLAKGKPTGPRLEEETWVKVPVPEASGLFTEYGIGLIAVNSEGEISMYSVTTEPLHEGGFERPTRVRLSPLVTWKLCPRIAITSLRVDNHYTPEKRASGRPWCVVQNVIGEIWTFSGDPRPEADVPIDILSEDEHWEEEMATAQTEIEEGPLSDELRNLSKEERAEAFKRHQLALATKLKEARDMETEKREAARKAYVQGSWVMIEHTRVERPISGFYLDDLGRELGLVLGDNDAYRVPSKNCVLEVDFFANVIVAFFCGGEDERRCRGARYRLNSDYVQPPRPPKEDEILGGQGCQGSADQWTLTKLKVPRSGEEIFNPQNFQKITTIALDDSPMCLSTIASTNDNAMGSNARYLAIGTNHGKVLLYNIRGDPIKRTSDTMNPMRIFKLSGNPAVSCLAVHSLAVIVGGNNGGVVIFDILGAIQHPLRKLVQASTPADKRKYVEAMREYGWTTQEAEQPWAELVNASSIAIDPDPRKWRGAVAVGAHILFWDETESIHWHLSDDVASRKKLNEAIKMKLADEAEESKRNRRQQRPRVGKAGGDSYYGNDDGEVEDMDEKELYRRWREAHGDMSEEERRILEREISGMSLMSDE